MTVADPRLTKTTTVYHAWRGEDDHWDGNEIYADLESAQQASAWYYANEEYSDLADIPAGQLVWRETIRYGRWELYDGDRCTNVEIAGRAVWKVAAPLCGVRVPASTAKNLGADPATTCARIPDHFGFAHEDAVGDVMWVDLDPAEAAK